MADAELAALRDDRAGATTDDGAKDLTGEDVQQSNQRYFGKLSKGSFGITFDYNQVPHNMGTQAHLLFLAHWDTRPRADAAGSSNPEAPVPGANDRASGTAVLLAVALWLVSPVIPAAAQMLGWAALLICSAVYLHAVDPLPPHASVQSGFFNQPFSLSLAVASRR